MRLQNCQPNSGTKSTYSTWITLTKPLVTGKSVASILDQREYIYIYIIYTHIYCGIKTSWVPPKNAAAAAPPPPPPPKSQSHTLIIHMAAGMHLFVSVGDFPSLLIIFWGNCNITPYRWTPPPPPPCI